MAEGKGKSSLSGPNASETWRNSRRGETLCERLDGSGQNVEFSGPKIAYNFFCGVHCRRGAYLWAMGH